MLPLPPVDSSGDAGEVSRALSRFTPRIRGGRERNSPPSYRPLSRRPTLGLTLLCRGHSTTLETLRASHPVSRSPVLSSYSPYLSPTDVGSFPFKKFVSPIVISALRDFPCTSLTPPTHPPNRLPNSITPPLRNHLDRVK